MRSKQQIEENNKAKLVKQLQDLKSDMSTLNRELEDISQNEQDISEVTPEVYNILLGIQRDLRFDKDKIKIIKKTIFR